MSIAQTRRQWLTTSSLTALGAATHPGPSTAHAAATPPEPRFLYSMNTSTIRGQKLTLAQEVAIVAAAGYDGIEPWTRQMEDHVKGGGSLADLGKQIRDLGLRVANVIGFGEWAVNEEARRAKGMEAMRHDMEMVKTLGGDRIAAPPVGLTDRSDVDLRVLADRYRALLELGDATGVIPMVEVWGFSKTLARLGDAAYVAIESRHPGASILPDVYHLYKGGSDHAGLRLLSSQAIRVIHMNDYPDRPSRAEINDADRVYPGDGVAPLHSVLRDLASIGFDGFLSLELFNKSYWAQDAAEVARVGLDKMKKAVAGSLA